MPELSGIIQNYLEGSISTIGRTPVIEEKSITENGTYTAPKGVDGYSPITVNVPQPQPVIQEKIITENGTYTAPEGVDGYDPITVDVPQPEPVIESKSITENGTYTAPEGVDGYSPITVNVPSIGTVIVNKHAIVNNRTLQPVSVTLTQGKYYAVFYFDDYLYPRSGTPNKLGCFALARTKTGTTVEQTLMNYANYNTVWYYTDSSLYLNNKIDNDTVYAYVTIVEFDASVVNPLIPS